MEQNPYKKWNSRAWRSAVQELQRSAKQHLVIMVDGVLALNKELLAGRTENRGLGVRRRIGKRNIQ